MGADELDRSVQGILRDGPFDFFSAVGYPLLSSSEVDGIREVAVQIDITNFCQLRCAHCRVPRFDTEHMPFDRFRDAVGSFADGAVRSLVIGGGEATLHPDFYAILAYAASAAQEVTLITNGLTRLDNEKLRSLPAELHIGISYDPVHPESYRRRGLGTEEAYWSCVVKNALAIDRTVADTFLTCAIPRAANLDAFLTRAIEFCRSIGAVGISTGRTIPVRGKCTFMAEDLTPSFKAFAETCREAGLKWNLRDPLMLVTYLQDHPGTLKALLEGGFKSGCPAGIDYAYIDPAGRVFLCPYIATPIGEIGPGQDIDAAWIQRQPLSRSILARELEGKCGSCDVKSLCGGCRATAWAATGSYLGSDPECCLGRAWGPVTTAKRGNPEPPMGPSEERFYLSPEDKDE